MKKWISVIGVVLFAGLCTGAKAAGHKMTVSLLPGVSIPVSGLYASNKSAVASFDTGMKASFATAIAVDYHEIGHSVDTGIQWLAKEFDGKLYLFTCNADKNLCKATLSGFGTSNA